MDALEAVWVELYRLQILAYLRRRAGQPVAPPNAWDLARWLRVEVGECSELMDELAEEGLIAPLPRGCDRLVCPLTLSEAGHGYLAWVARHPQ